ncbi:MAG: hypothetical protein JO001_00405, partial [Alphaproteobacteria bacterium]|nr:hypothetical protein [Alphaproteobacteria bacterium]
MHVGLKPLLIGGISLRRHTAQISGMAKLDAAAVAKLLVELGRRTALIGGDSYFRSRAYVRAAEHIAALTEPLGVVVDEGRLQQIPGIGTVIADVVTALHCTGTHPLLERLRQDVPESVLDMLTIPGLKPEKIDILHRELGISTLEELETAVREDRLKSVKGLGPALQRKILQGLEIREKTIGAKHVHRAADLVDTAIENLRLSGLG